MKRLPLGIIIFITIFITTGCESGFFSELGSTTISRPDGTEIIETTDLDACTKTIFTHFKDGTETERTFPLDPELCQKAKKEKE